MTGVFFSVIRTCFLWMARLWLNPTWMAPFWMLLHVLVLREEVLQLLTPALLPTSLFGNIGSFWVFFQGVLMEILVYFHDQKAIFPRRVSHWKWFIHLDVPTVLFRLLMQRSMLHYWVRGAARWNLHLQSLFPGFITFGFACHFAMRVYIH